MEWADVAAEAVVNSGGGNADQLTGVVLTDRVRSFKGPLRWERLPRSDEDNGAAGQFAFQAVMSRFDPSVDLEALAATTTEADLKELSAFAGECHRENRYYLMQLVNETGFALSLCSGDAPRAAAFAWVIARSWYETRSVREFEVRQEMVQRAVEYLRGADVEALTEADRKELNAIEEDGDRGPGFARTRAFLEYFNEHVEELPIHPNAILRGQVSKHHAKRAVDPATVAWIESHVQHSSQ